MLARGNDYVSITLQIYTAVSLECRWSKASSSNTKDPSRRTQRVRPFLRCGAIWLEQDAGGVILLWWASEDRATVAEIRHVVFEEVSEMET